MIRKEISIRPVLSSALIIGTLALSLVATGCGKKTAVSSNVDAAVVSGADVTFSVDVAAVNKSAFATAARAEKDAAEKAEAEAIAKRFEEATGLTEDDVLYVMGSADLDSVDVNAENKAEEIKKFSGAVGVALAKSITAKQLNAGLDIILEKTGPNLSKSTATVAGTEMITLKSIDPDAPVIYVAQDKTGKLVLLSVNETGITDALKRADSGKSEKISKSVQTVEKALEANSQAKISIALSEAMKKELTNRINDMASSEGGAMMAGMATPFIGLESISIGVMFDDNLNLNLAINLGSVNSATQAMGALNMVVSMVQGSIAQNAQLSPEEMQKKFKLETSGSSVILKVILTAKDLS